MIYSISRYLVKETACLQVPCSCNVHHRFALGLCEDAIPRARTFGGVRQVTCPSRALHKEHQEVDLHPLLQQIRRIGRSVDTTGERAIRDRVQNRAPPPEKGLHHPRNDYFFAECHRARQGGPPRRIAWHDSPAISASVVWGLWQALGGCAEVRSWRLARPQEISHRKRRGGRRQGGGSVWGIYPSRDRSSPPENVATHGNSAQDPSEVRPHYPGGGSPTATV